MTQCYGFVGQTGTGAIVYFIGCATNPEWTVNPIYGTSYYFPSDGGTNITGNGGYGAVPISGPTLLLSQAAITAWLGGNSPDGNCAACILPTYDCVGGACQQNTSGTGAYSSLSACQSSCAWYDCLNGNCVQNTTYNTPGTYKSLVACNTSCGGATCPSGQTCFDPNNLPCPVCPTCPACPDCPDCPDSDGVCPPCPPAPPSAGSCPTGQTCQLHTGEDVNFVNISAPIFLGSCDSSGNPVLGSQSIQVIQGTEALEFLKLQELAQIQGNSYCNAGVGACPTGWQIRPEYHRPQAIYQFAQIDASGNIVGAPKYEITVPHHAATKPTTPLPNYQRGNWETIFVLNDNSKVTIHSLDAANGNLMLNAIKLLIDPAQLTNAYLSKSCLVITNTDIAQITVKNRMAKYWSEGAKNELPDWVEKW